MRGYKEIFFFLVLILSCKSSENEIQNLIEAPKGMVWVEGKTYVKGAKNNDIYAMNREKPSHEVYIDGFFIDATEITNNQFKKFV